MEKHPLRIIREQWNLSIDRLAAETGLSDRTILRAEQGKPINPSSRGILSDYFGQSTKELGLLPQGPSTVEETELAMDKLRRRLLAGTFVSATSTLLFPRADTDIVERLMSVQKKPARIDESTLAYLEAEMSGYWQLLPDIIGLSSSPLLKCIEDQLKNVMQLLSVPQSDTVEKRLWNIVGELTQIGGQMAFDMRQHDLASAYYREAINASQFASNNALLAVALTRMSFLHTYEQKPWDAIPYQQEAQRLAQHGTTNTTRAWIAAVAAEAYANTGDVDECLQALEQAEATDPAITPDTDPYWTGFDRVKVGGYAGACYLKIQQPGKALSVLQSSLEIIEPSRIRYQSILLTDIAKAYAQQAAYDEAASYANRALALTRHTKSANVLSRIEDFVSQLPPEVAAAAYLQEQSSMLHL